MQARFFLAALMLGSFVGCATVTPAPGGQHVARPAMESFELQGRFAAKQDTQGGHGRFEWQHSPVENVLSLISPLGGGLGTLYWHDQQASLHYPSGQVVAAADAQALSAQLIGVAIPVQLIPGWVQALPSKNAQILEQDEKGRVVRFSEAGWFVRIADYADEQAQALPNQIEAQRGEMSLRLILDAWQNKVLSP